MDILKSLYGKANRKIVYYKDVNSEIISPNIVFLIPKTSITFDTIVAILPR